MALARLRNAAAMGPLSMCARKYLLACTKASSLEADGACVPTFPSMPSQKAKGFVRGTAQIGTTGFGFVAISPTVANDTNCIYFSDSSYTGFAISDILAPGVNGVAVANLPFPSSVINQANSGQRATGRIVGAELTVQYTGTMLKRSGMFYGFTDPNHNSVNGYGVTTVGTKQTARVVANHGQRVSVSIAAVRPDETEYPKYDGYATATENAGNRNYPFSDSAGSSPGAGSLISCIVFTGEAGETVQFEYHQHCEFTGSACAGRLTENDIDTPGFQAVNTAVNQAQQSSSQSDPYQSVADNLAKFGYTAGRAMRGMSEMYMGYKGTGMPNGRQRLGA